jgi:outer membrane protein assembly factor BamE (lipoprotein component of BamABCDE complex)
MLRNKTPLAVLIVASTTTGCSLAMMAPNVVEGQQFPIEQVDKLRAGMSASQVEALLGTPYERSNSASFEWRYAFTRRLRECRWYLGPIPMQPARTERHVLDLTFGSSGLERAIYRDAAPERTSERVLVGRSNGAG